MPNAEREVWTIIDKKNSVIKTLLRIQSTAQGVRSIIRVFESANEALPTKAKKEGELGKFLVTGNSEPTATTVMRLLAEGIDPTNIIVYCDNFPDEITAPVQIVPKSREGLEFDEITSIRSIYHLKRD